MKIILFLSIFCLSSILVKAQTVNDIDGNVYNTVTIGSQEWMVENLKVTKYRNGDLISTTNPDTLNISGESNPKYQWIYKSDSSNLSTFGRLYTGYVVSDSRGLCPTGWHVPWDVDWTTLENFLQANEYNYDGSIDNDGDRSTNNKIAKSLASTTNWASSNNIGAIGNNDYPNYRNKSGFSALPGGIRRYDINFYYIETDGAWWSASESGNGSLWSRELSHYIDNVIRSEGDMKLGMSVRCVNDNTVTIDNSVVTDKVAIYPNPASEMIYIHNIIDSKTSIKIFDIQGNLVISRDNASEAVDISSLSNGIYIVVLICESDILNSKLIKK
jgi:uncharacterized protein (TIGR02145 family)